jgi:hypothetical protein
MSGRIAGSTTVQLRAGVTHVSIPLTAAQGNRLRAAGSSALVSFETARDEVQALDVPIRLRE